MLNPYTDVGMSDEDYLQEKLVKFWMATVFDKKMAECECEVINEPSEVLFDSNRQLFLLMMQSGSFRGKLMSGQYIFYDGRICVNDPNLFYFDGESFVLKEGVSIDEVSLAAKQVKLSGEKLDDPDRDYDVLAFEKGHFRQNYYPVRYYSKYPPMSSENEDGDKLDVKITIDNSGSMPSGIDKYCIDKPDAHYHEFYTLNGKDHNRPHHIFNPDNQDKPVENQDKPAEKQIKTWTTSVYECSYAGGINELSKEDFDSYMEDMFGMPRKLSDILKYWIKKKNTTQEALAMDAGISPRTLSRMITDEDYQPKLKTVVAVCIALHLFPMISNYIVDRAGLSFKDNLEGYACQLLLNVYYKSSIEECNYFMIRMGAGPLSDKKEE